MNKDKAGFFHDKTARARPAAIFYARFSGDLPSLTPNTASTAMPSSDQALTDVQSRNKYIPRLAPFQPSTEHPYTVSLIFRR
ncbi:protein of unknown function [Xenorhabdus doucetiae]|uniref:Uncharacterized protein n=1 Tax=Xenorhabdus doucetiae TaxID=351671 RepID=A0A068QMW9_9GAMM|nr:protein of unknown function [Xenorhabdus doucetiae]